MDKVIIKLQVFFEEPFWIGICEREEDNKLSVCKITFGVEPKGFDIQQFMLDHWYHLPFSLPIDGAAAYQKHKNAKRVLRDVKKQMKITGIGTKSQQALKLQQELGKSERKTRNRDQKELEKEWQFELKQQKRKEKHRGR